MSRPGRAAILVALSVAAPAAPRAQLADRAQTEAMAHRASERIEALRREADALAAQERSLLVELRRLEVERDLRAEELKQLDAELGQISRQLGDTRARIQHLERTVVAQRPGVDARLVVVSKLGRGGYVRLLLGTPDLRSLGRAFRMVAALARINRERVKEYRKNVDALRAGQAALEERSARMAALLTESRQKRAGLDRAVLARSQLIQQIDQRRDLNAQFVGDLQAAQQKLQQALASLSAGAGARPPAAEPVNLPLRPFRGDLDWPVRGSVTNLFVRGREGRSGAAPLRNGIEIAAAEGSPVRAIHEGSVAYADPFTGFGTLVIIDHGNDAYSLYGYLSSLAVSRQARVDRGQVIGSVGAAPAGHIALYFELRVDGKPVDPIEWLKR